MGCHCLLQVPSLASHYTPVSLASVPITWGSSSLATRLSSLSQGWGGCLPAHHCNTVLLAHSHAPLLLYVVSAVDWSHCMCVCVLNCSVRSDSLTLWTATCQAPLWEISGKNTRGFHFLLQGIFLTQEFNLCLLHLLHCRQILYRAIREAPELQ